MRKFSIKEWAETERPREKLLSLGSDHLSNSELLAILINTGTPQATALDIARALLHAVNNDLSKLGALSVRDIRQLNIKGLGTAKAISIVASLELGVRRQTAITRKEKINTTTDMAAFLKSSFQFYSREIFAVVFLNQASKILQVEIISEGGITGTVADPRIILKKALEHQATAIILCHNHPSGNLKPSSADEILTQKIKTAAGFLDIKVADHIIVSSEGYYSFAEEGLL
ncbi:MAG: DNA repair protein RadC [Chitinophagaceae bacterium]|nr:DNA repair protein RadC [Chitinophagaceae bacterium]